MNAHLDRHGQPAMASNDDAVRNKMADLFPQRIDLFGDQRLDRGAAR
jgi:hypothetical protein